MDRSRLGLLVGLVGTVAVVAAGVYRPTQIPQPVVIGAVLLLGVILWFVAVRYVLIACYRLWRRISARLYWALTLVLPESPLVRFAAGSMVLIAAIIVIVGGLPMLVGNLQESDEGAAGYANELGNDAMNAEWDDIVNGDTVGGEPACDGSVAAGGDRTDRDEDGLPDAWERAGETPDGAPLPGADPGRKDLYVQLRHGNVTEPLSAAERRQLRESWAAMPVENPDGTSGITVHLAQAGDVGGPARITRLEDRDRWYTEEYLGSRQCVYRQVVYGSVAVDGIAGVASTPGYAAVVEGTRRPDYPGNVSLRVAVTNHELLHTAAGTVDGRSHPSEGWLASPPGHEHLSGPVADDLNETGIHGPAS